MGSLIQQNGLTVLVIVQIPGIDNRSVGFFKLDKPCIKPASNHFIRDMVPALGGNQVGIDENGTLRLQRQKFPGKRGFSCAVGTGNALGPAMMRMRGGGFMGFAAQGLLMPFCAPPSVWLRAASW